MFRNILTRTVTLSQVTHGCFGQQSTARLLAERCYCSIAATKERLQAMVDKDKVVVFMKGVPEEPRCGFSNLVVQILRMHGVKYTAYNVLDDDSIREGVKKFSDWPTIPQVFIGGEFVGGSDILLQMHKEGDLVPALQKVGISSALASDGGQ